MGDLYRLRDFSSQNEYKWTLIISQIQKQRSETNESEMVIFSNIKKDYFAKVLIHYFLQLYQNKKDPMVFMGDFVPVKTIIDGFKKHYTDYYEELKLHIKEKTYGTTSYLKDCLDGLKKIDLIKEIPHPQIDALSLNLKQIQHENDKIGLNLEIDDDIGELVNIALGEKDTLAPSVGTNMTGDLVYE